MITAYPDIRVAAGAATEAITRGEAELAATAALVASKSGAVERKRIVIEGAPAESAAKLVDTLRQEGVL